MTTGRAETTSQGMGIQTSALGAGGKSSAPVATNVVEEYDGTSWTASPALPRNMVGGCAGGTTASAWAAGGTTTAGSGPTVTNSTVLWNGTAWSTSPATLGTAKYALGGSGTGAAGLAFGGNNATNVKQASTDEYSEAAVEAQTITTS